MKTNPRIRHLHTTELVNGIDDNGGYINTARTFIVNANRPHIERENVNTYTVLGKPLPAIAERMRVIIENTETQRIAIPCKPYTYTVFGQTKTATQRIKDVAPSRLSFYVLAFNDEDAVETVLQRLAVKGQTPSWTARITVANRFRRYSFSYHHLFDEWANPFYPFGLGLKRGRRRF